MAHNHPRQCLVLCLALALRSLVSAVGWMWAAPEPLVREPDSHGYIRAAEALVDAAQFGPPGEPELMRTPGYPLLLIPGVWLRHIDLTTILLQVCLGSLTALLVYRLAIECFQREDYALAAALFFACEPVSVLYCSKLLSETLFTTALTLSLWQLACWLRRAHAGCLIAAAVAQAGAIFVRPIAYALPCLLGVVLLAAGWRPSVCRRKLLASSIAFILLSMAPVWAWQARNYFAVGYAHFSAISDINVYFYQAAAIIAERKGESLEKTQHGLGYFDERVYLARHPNQRSWSQARRYAWLGREGRRIIGQHPALALQIQLRGAAALLLDPGASAYLGYFRLNQPPPKPARRHDQVEATPGFLAKLSRGIVEKPLVMTVYAITSFAWLCYAVLAIRGLMMKAVWQSRPAWLLLSTAAMLIALSGGPVGYHRFRIPIMPVVCLLAGCGAVALRGALHRRTG